MTNYKPILKWVGGKTQIIDKLTDKFPKEINNYHEIFLGGGSVLLAFLTHVRNGNITINNKIYAYDLNEPLIYVYKNVQNNHDELYEIISSFINNYNKCPINSPNNEVNRKPSTIEEAKQSKESYYYWMRITYNKLNNNEKKTPLGSAMFIFLNKTCFRGLFREGPNGFNVPYGNYKNPEIINKEHLDEIHTLIQGVIFESCDFSISLCKPGKGDFVYCDPPYAPETDTSFVGYTKDGFGIDQHEKLFNMCVGDTGDTFGFLMSNSNTDIVKKHFPEKDYKNQIISAKRSINSKNPDAKTTELIISNYFTKMIN